MSYQLKGTKEVLEGLKDLDAKITYSLLRSFNRKALKEKAFSPVERSFISRRGTKSLAIKPIQGEKNKSAIAIGPTSSGYVERFLQKGTKERITKKGQNRGSIKGGFKLKTGIEQTIDPIIDYVNTDLGNEVEKILKRRIKTIQNRINKIK